MGYAWLIIGTKIVTGVSLECLCSTWWSQYKLFTSPSCMCTAVKNRLHWMQGLVDISLILILSQLYDKVMVERLDFTSRSLLYTWEAIAIIIASLEKREQLLFKVETCKLLAFSLTGIPLRL